MLLEDVINALRSHINAEFAKLRKADDAPCMDDIRYLSKLDGVMKTLTALDAKRKKEAGK